jgi:Phage Tail Collar Domain
MPIQPIVITLAEPPPGWSGNVTELFVLIQSRITGGVSEGFLTGSVGSQPPPPDSGPWFKNGGIDGVFVWDPVKAEYVPISQNIDVGKIEMFAYGAVDLGKWVVCNGASVPRVAPYDVLFSRIGTTFGAGDGSTTFNVPDIRGRCPIGGGAGFGLTTRFLGQQMGAETHALTPAEVPALATVSVESGSAAPLTPVTGYSSANGAAHSLMQPSMVFTFAIRFA